MEWTEADKAELIHPGFTLPYQPLATQVFEKTRGLSTDEHRCGAPSAESRNIATRPDSVKWHVELRREFDCTRSQIAGKGPILTIRKIFGPLAMLNAKREFSCFR